MNNKSTDIKNDNTSNEKVLKRISFYLFLIIILLFVIVFKLENLNMKLELISNSSSIEFSTNEEHNEVLDVFLETTEKIGENLPLYNEIEDTSVPNTTVKKENNITEITPSTSNVSGKITYVINKNSKKMHYKTCSFVNRMKEENKVIVQLNKDELNNYLNSGYAFCSTCGG